MKVSPSNVIAAVVFMAMGVALGQRDQEPVVVTLTDTVAIKTYAAKLNSLRLEADGLRARLEQVERRKPARVVVVDTLIPPPDTVYRIVRVDGRGSLAVEVLVGRDSLYAPELRDGVDVSDCDDGYAIQGGEVLCDKARFGHLFLAGRLGTDVGVGLYWEPKYRSGWRVGAMWEVDRWSVNVTKGWRLF